jgi:signal transduction histidine kinase
MATESELLAQIEELKNQLATAHAQQWKLIRTVCHELRLPLSSIKGYNDLLPLMGPISDQQKDFVTRIKKNVVRLTGMIANLHDLAMFGEGHFELKSQSFSALDALEDVCDEMETVAAEQQNKLVRDLPKTLPDLKTEEARFKQIVRILIDNACLYTPAGGQITVTAQTTDGFIKISVKDTGIGVPENERPALFTLFFRGDSEVVREKTGAGMNLYMVKRYLEFMGGSCGVEFPAEGGSNFWAKIPVAS